MNIETAQLELRRGYLRGGPGAIVSGVVWLVSDIASSFWGVPIGFAALFFGGMLIFPIASLIVRNVLRCDPVSKDNPGSIIVIETIFPMIAGLMAAWLFIPYRLDFVFPLAAIAVGAHYFGFRSAYGDWANWVLGGIMCMIGMAAIFGGMSKTLPVPYLIAGVEMGFGIGLTWNSLSKDKLADGNSL